MIKINKINFQELPSDITNEIEEGCTFEYYQVNQDINVIGYFIAYDNEFHLKHKYLYPIKNTFTLLKDKQILKAIRKYFGKPLQVMIDSNQKDAIKVLDQVGFTLRRECYEREFNIKALVDLKEPLLNIKIFKKETCEYDQAFEMAFEHYVKTHKNVSLLTATKQQFKEILPKQALCQISAGKILNVAFIDEHELCYFASKNEEQFELFSYSVVRYMFKRYDTISFEVDSTDELDLKLKSCFIDDSNDSFDTYVYKGA